MDPTEASTPAAMSRSVNAIEVYWLPASLLSRIRLNSDYVEENVKPSKRPAAGCRWGQLQFLSA